MILSKLFNSKNKKNDDWIYETGRTNYNVIGGRLPRYQVQTTKNEQEAFERISDGYYNYIVRYKKRWNMITEIQWYSDIRKEWINSETSTKSKRRSK